MGFRQNIMKQEDIERCGITAGLPLFEQTTTDQQEIKIKKTALHNYKLPSWIWDGSQLKAEVYNRLKDKFSARRLQILEALLSLGKGTDRDIQETTGLEINQITGRRGELQKLGVVVSFGETKIGPYGEPNTIYQVNYEKLREYLGEKNK